MSSEETFPITLNGEEGQFLLTLLAAYPPQSDKLGEFTPSNALKDWPKESYLRAWMALDNKVRNALGGGGPAPGSVGELLGRTREILAELRQLGVIRTDNAPTGDYAEWLVYRVTGGDLEANSAKSHDVLAPATETHPEGERIQVKARSLSDPPKKGQRQLSVFRSWDFDFLVAVLFDERFRVYRAARLPVDIVEERAGRVEHVNGWRIMATDELLDLGEDWTERLNEVASQSA